MTVTNKPNTFTHLLFALLIFIAFVAASCNDDGIDGVDSRGDFYEQFNK